MKIAFTNSAWPQSWGGGEKWTIEAADWFRKNGHAVVVIGRPQSLVVSRARARGLEVYDFGFRGDFDWFARRRAGQLLRELAPDILIVNFNKEAWTFGSSTRALNIPLVARHGFPLLRSTFYHRHLVRRYLTRIVTNAEYIRERYSQLGYDTSRMELILNGVDTQEQKRGEMRNLFGLGHEDLLIVGAGRLESQKRFDRLIDLTHELLPKYPNLHTVIFGQGPLENELRNDARMRNIENSVHFAGFREDFAALVGDADLFLLTSDEEGTPNALLEALAAGVASVSFEVGSVSQILHDELSANIIPAGNLMSMRARIDQLLASVTLRETVARQCAERARSEFSVDESMGKYAKLFESVIHA